MKKSVVLFLLLSLILVSCQKAGETKLTPNTQVYQIATELSKKLACLDPEKNQSIISTNTFKVTSGELIQFIRDRYGNRVSQLVDMDVDQLKLILTQAAEDIALTKMIVDKADKAGVTVDPAALTKVLEDQYQQLGSEEEFKKFLTDRELDFEKVKTQITEELKLKNYLDSLFDPQISVTEKDIDDRYVDDKTATVRHILLLTSNADDAGKAAIRKKMEGILAEAKAGADFATLATKYTEDPGSKENGGLYEKFGRGRMVKPFEDASFTLPIGSISDIIETQYGFHILKVIERQKETRSREEVKEEIRNEKKQPIYTAYVENLKKETNFTLNDELKVN